MRRTTQLVAAIVLMCGCGGETSGPVDKDIATLRQVTEPLRNFQVATNSGWSAQITACMQDAGGAGGMGFHYGNPALIDGTARVSEPELLLYEPKADGTLSLVAVEYIIPYTAHARSDTPPVLFGHEFKQNDTFELWGLHAWVWKDNPDGVFADWNRLVGCSNTDQVTVMSHRDGHGDPHHEEK